MSRAIHPARSATYDDLAAGLDADVEAKRVRVTRDGPLALYGYTERAAFARDWTPTALLARGLILDVEERRVVATPFPKFFNLGEGWRVGEPADPLPDEPFEVTEKMDGSLAIVFLHGGRWRVATRGSFVSDQARWAERWLRDRCRVAALEPGSTYLAEVIYPENRVVVPYGPERTGLHLLAAYDERGIEHNLAHRRDVAAEVGLGLAPAVPFRSLDELVEVARLLAADAEGFVVRFASGLRVKVKGDEYCRIHRLVSRVTPLGVWDVFVEDGDVEVLASQLPEEFRGDVRRIWAILAAKLDVFLAAVEVATRAASGMDDRSLGLWLSTQTEVDPEIARWIFPSRKRGFLDAARRPGDAARRRACETFRPTGNRLDGYAPSTILDRVFEAS